MGRGRRKIVNPTLFSLELVSLVLFISLCISCKEVEEHHPPNMIFIMMDDLGYGQFGLHNDDLTTSEFDPYFVQLVKENQDYTPQEALAMSKVAIPTISKLAKEGVQFKKAFTSSNLCAPSRIGIATGMLQNRFGIYRNVDAEQRGLDPGSHLAKRLHDLGYGTAHIGKWHVGSRDDQMVDDVRKKYQAPDSLSYRQLKKDFPKAFEELHREGYYGSVIREHHPLTNGFDYYYGYNTWASQFYNSTLVWENYDHAGKQEGYNTDVFTDRALDFMREQIEETKPFYVQLHYHAVHDSLEPKAPDQYFSKFNSASYDLNNFYAHINGVDENIKKVVDYLASENQLNNTIIVFTSDNGAQAGGPSTLPGNAPFSGTKGTMFQGGIRVPLFVHWPNGITKPKVSKQLVSTLDILPTLIDAAGDKVPDHLDGKSLLSLLKSESVTESHGHLVWAGIHSRAWGFLINTSFKNHSTERDFAPPAWAVVKGEFMLRYVGELEENIYREIPQGKAAEYQLFNLEEDPAEKNNLADQLPDKVQELTAIFREESKDFEPPVWWAMDKWNELNINTNRNHPL